MQDESVDFPLTENSELYQQALALYERTEKEYGHSARVNGINMAYLEFGSSDGMPLIWAHGSGGGRYELFMVQEELVKAGYRVISIDYRGHGKTQLEVTPYNTSLYHIADDIAALMDHLDIPKAIIGGLSKGGWIAAAFYDTYPDRCLGLLLEDGGSFSHLRLAEDAKLNLVKPIAASKAVTAEANQKLYNPTTLFNSQIEGLSVVWQGEITPYSDSCQQVLNADVRFWVILLSHLRKVEDGWVPHCGMLELMQGKHAGRSVDSELLLAKTLYSRLPIMQRSQELMDPLVIFRNLHVPMHIIDPDSPTTLLQVRHQNEELQQLHPDLIVHEPYTYEHSPHAAHIERPERFIESANALLVRVKEHAGMHCCT